LIDKTTIHLGLEESLHPRRNDGLGSLIEKLGDHLRRRVVSDRGQPDGEAAGQGRPITGVAVFAAAVEPISDRPPGSG
jgi:hypothetical protein